MSKLLSDKQDYYRSYPSSGWFFHEPPTLDRELVARFEAAGGKDDWGDPRYRLTWGGVGIVRKSEDENERSIIRGGEAGVHVVHGIQQVKYFDGKVRYPKCWHYKIRKGKRVKDCQVKRQEDIPKSAHGIFAEYEYMWLGRMRWYIEVKLSAQELVDCGYRDSFDKSIPPKGDYVYFKIIETPDGQYFEPNRQWLEYVQWAFQDVQNESSSDLLARDTTERKAWREQQAAEQEEKEDKEYYSLLDKLLKEPSGTRAYSIPGL